jgi:HEAT repeat protein
MPGLPGGLGTGVWGPLTDPGIAAMLSENEVMEMVRLLMRLGHQVSGTERTAEGSIALREAVLGMDVKPAAVLVNLLAQAPAELGERSTAQVLVDLAEKLAIRYAIGQLEGGSQPAEATRKLINRLAQQILELRKAVLSRDLKLREAGISLESYPEELDRKFWLGVSPTTRTRILRSTEAWAIPIKNIRIHLEELLASGKEREARFILQNYSSSLVSPEAEARQRTLAGVSQLMDLVQRMATPDFLKHFRQVLLERLAQETGSATVKPVVFMLAQVEEMAWRRAEYETARDILATLYKFSREPSERGRECATQFEEIIQDKKLSDRLQSVIASHSPDIRRAVHVFSLLPEKIIQLAMELAERESNPLRRQTISELIGGLGTAATPVLRRMLLSDRKRTVMTALEWLERGHPESILQALPQMVPKQDPQVQYAAITAVIHRDVAGRVRILLDILPHLHRYVQPRVIDELGMLREHDAIGLLIEYATGAKFPDEPYLRVKAIEALGRIGAEQAVEPLVRILSERSFMSSSSREEPPRNSSPCRSPKSPVGWNAAAAGPESIGA